MNVEDLYWVAHQLSGTTQQAAFLADLESKSPGDAQKVRELLNVGQKADDLFGKLDKPTQPDASCDSNQNSDQAGGSFVIRTRSARLQTGETIGPYKLLEPIGEGGMGVVYLAQQLEPVRRKVALKIIKPGMDSQQVVARFEAERQALAMMEHPNIARALDAGTTEIGLPYFVMELVRGIPMSEYCDRANMPNHERLKLFCDACGAIQHAHNKGIIHRDVKPSNVLVTEHDGTPVVKVIDFGVAKALTDNLTDKTLFTGMFQMIGTPLYMSPEQASLSSLDVDVRSDVYSLGVMLYELLSGMLPIDRESVKGLSFDELRQRIVESAPPRPSKRLSTLKDERETIAARHGIDAKSFHCLVTGELDWIVMKAIEHDRNRRYQSAAELSADVKRYLADEPVLACPPNWTYRFGKFAQRHRTSLLSACMLLFIILSAAVISVDQAFKARRAETIARENEIRAQKKTHELFELLYAQDMRSVVEHALAGDHRRLQTILDRYSYGPGAKLRGFEWDLYRSLRPADMRALHQDECRINDVVQSDAGTLFVADSLGRLIAIDPASDRKLGQWLTDHQDTLALEWTPPNDLLTCGSDGTVTHHRLTSMRDGRWRKEVLRRIIVQDQTLMSLAADPSTQTAWTAGKGGAIYQIDLSSGDFHVLSNDPSVRSIRDLEFSQRLGLFAATGVHIVQYGFDATTAQESAESGMRKIAAVTLSPEMASIRDLEICESAGVVWAGQLLGSVTRLDVSSSEFPQPTMRIGQTQMLSDNIHSLAVSPDGEWLMVGDSTGHLQMVKGDGDVTAASSFAFRLEQSSVRICRPHQDKVLGVKLLQSPNDGIERSGSLKPQEIAVASVGRDGRVMISKPLSSVPVEFDPMAPGGNRNQETTKLLLAWAKRVLMADPPPQDDPERFVAEGGLIHRVSRAKDANETFFLVNETSLVSDRGRRLWRAKSDEKAIRIAVSPDAADLAICVESQSDNKHEIEVYSLGESTPRYRLPSTTSNDIVFSPSGDLLAFVFNDDIRIVDGATGELIHELRQHRNSVTDIDFDPTGEFLASVSEDRRLIVWKVESGKPMWSQLAHRNRALAVAFHPSLPTLATAGSDSVVRFWTNRELIASDEARLVGEYPIDAGFPTRLQFSDEGDSLHILHSRRGISTLSAH